MMGSSVADDDYTGSAFHDLRKVLGDETLLTLIEACGGTRIKVPKMARSSSSLAQVIGLSALRRLVDVHGSCYVSVPVARRFRVLALRRQGSSHSQIAVRLCMTEQSVSRHLATGVAGRQETIRKTAADADLLNNRQKLP